MGRRRSHEAGAPNTGARRLSLSQFYWLLSLSARSLAAGAIAFLFIGCADGAPTAPALAPHAPARAAAAAPPASDVIPDEYIVTFADSVKDASGLAKQLAAQHGASVRFTYGSALKGFAAHMSAQAAAALAKNPRIAAIEFDRVAVGESTESNPPAWGLDRIDQRTRTLDKSFTYAGDGTGVNVYILDSGIRASHTDLGGRAIGAYSAINDGRGTSDCTGHGTHVAGIIGGQKFGVAKAARLFAVRVLDCSNYGTYSAFIAGIDWVTKNRVLPAVANMSIGGATSAAVNSAVQASINAGVVYVVSAGNNATDACTQSPASAPAAITVAASDQIDAQAGYSNYGACVDIYAPGSSILSTWYTTDSATFYASGTSMASPHVAGAAALYLSANPAATPAEVATALVANATTGALSGLGAGSPDRLLYVGFIGAAATSSMPLPTPAPAPAPAPTTLPPTAKFSVSCSKGSCTFDGSASMSAGGIATYAWDFGNAVTQTGSNARVTYAYQKTGNYTIRLTVTDTNGATGSASQGVQIRKL